MSRRAGRSRFAATGGRIAALAAALLAVVLVATWAGRARRPNVLFIVVDTLRADRLGCYGNARALTPFIDRLAARGVQFRNAYATSSWTIPSVGSLFTSRYPSENHVLGYGSEVAEDEETLAEELRRHGYATAGFSANILLKLTPGFGQGFDTWYVSWGKEGQVNERAADLGARALAWLDEPAVRASGAPALLYLHYMEPHLPYAPEEPFRARFASAALTDRDVERANEKLRGLDFRVTAAELELLQNLYDGEVAELDDQLRRTFASLEERGFLNDALVILTSDHGEEFKEHGRLTHGHDLYNETIRVPLLLLGRGVAEGAVVEDDVSLVDLAPTILELLDLPPEPAFRGRSLVPLWSARGDGWPSWNLVRRWRAGGETEPRPVFSELLETSRKRRVSPHERAVVFHDEKLIIGVDGEREFYDLRKDPGETDPQALPEPERARLLGAVDILQQSPVERAAGGEATPIDDETRERMRALGYHE